MTSITSMAGTDVLWARVQCDGSTVKVWMLKKTEAYGTPTESDWSAISGSPVMNTAWSFSLAGGRMGIAAPFGGNTATVDDITIKSYDGSAWVTEAYENFTLDGSGYAADTLTYDNNGNLLYDGTQSYIYNAWNQQVKIAHAYRDSGGTLHSGQTNTTCTYDPSGRRITKAIANTGAWDCTYRYFYTNSDQAIEEQNGSGQSIKDHVWGLTYVDEIIQTRINTTPSSTATWSSYYLLQDANFNVLGVTDSSGVLKERYEYGAYGLRQVFASAGSNDTGCYAGFDASAKVVTSGSVIQPYGLNEIGHQGLQHDEATTLVYNRARYLHPILGRFCQNDPMGFADGMNSYANLSADPINFSDASGQLVGAPPAAPPQTVTPSPVSEGGPIWTPDSPPPTPQTPSPPPPQNQSGWSTAGNAAMQFTAVTRAARIGYEIGTAIDETFIAPEFASNEAYIDSVNDYQRWANNHIRAQRAITAQTNQNLATAVSVSTAIDMATRADANRKAGKCPCKFPIDINTTGFSIREKKDTISYALLTNAWLEINGPQVVHSPTNEWIFYEGQLRTMKRTADMLAKREKRAHPGVYGLKVAGHVPDTCISGKPNPWLWLPMEDKANRDIGRQEQNHVGQPVECITVDGKSPGSSIPGVFQ